MATISNTPRPGYVWDSTDNVWYPIGVGAHQHTNAADTPAVMPYSTYAAAGKNKIINGDFGINQRAFTSITTSYTVGFDRWRFEYSGGTTTMSAQAFTPGNAIGGYEPTNYLRVVTSGMSGTNDYSLIQYAIEDARTLAGQTVTLSFWAKAASGTPNIGISGYQNFPGGNGFTNLPTNVITIGTTWNRYSVTFTMPSVSGKTIIAGSATYLYIGVSSGSGVSGVFGNVGLQNNTFDFWGVQLEAGSTATAFQTATGTIQGELAACQRYYYRQTGTDTNTFLSNAGYGSNNAQYVYATITNPVTMRTTPTVLDYANVRFGDGTNFALPTILTISASAGGASQRSIQIYYSTGGLVQYRPYWITCNTNAAAYIGLGAEL